MLEKRKEESESIGKYQSVLTGLIIGAIVIWGAPFVVEFMFGVELFNTDDISDSEAVTALAERIEEIYNLAMWVIRIVLVLGVLIAVFMLRLRRGRRS